MNDERKTKCNLREIGNCCTDTIWGGEESGGEGRRARGSGLGEQPEKRGTGQGSLLQHAHHGGLDSTKTREAWRGARPGSALRLATAGLPIPASSCYIVRHGR